MNEIIFIAEEAPNLESLHVRVRNGMSCHFDKGEASKIIRLHFIKEEVISL